MVDISRSDPTLSAAVDDLAAALHGRVIRTADPEYDTARALYSGNIDKRPAAIAQCADVADVVTTVGLCRDRGIDLAVRCGGHSGAGFGSVDGGVVLDLSLMKDIQVDAASRTARVGGGALLGEVDTATAQHGLATPFGIISTTGVGGLTLGGGHGYLTRLHGLSIDNMLSADVVLADGTVVTADAAHEPDLFWALRGGGGNFGVVTSFTFALHPVSTVVAGPTLWHLDRAEEVLRFYREFLPSVPREVYGFFAFLVVPPGPPFPEELHLKPMCGVVWCVVAPPERAEVLLAPVRATRPALDGIQPMPYTALQSAFDPLLPPGLQWYWRGDFLDQLSDPAVAEHLRYGTALPTPLSTMHLYPIDGAVHDVAPTETAFSYRGSTWSSVFAGIDPDPAQLDGLRAWTVDYWQALHPYSAGGAYVNFMMEEGQQRVAATYRQNYVRLAQVKAAYDPQNVFHVNQNIAPAAGAVPQPREPGTAATAPQEPAAGPRPG